MDDDDRCHLAVAEATRTSQLAAIYNSGAGSAGIRRALERLDPERSVVWISHELSDDHRQYLQSGALAMVIDQDPDAQAASALRYLIERVASDARELTIPQACEFRVYFSENAKDEVYLSKA